MDDTKTFNNAIPCVPRIRFEARENEQDAVARAFARGRMEAERITLATSHKRAVERPVPRSEYVVAAQICVCPSCCRQNIRFSPCHNPHGLSHCLLVNSWPGQRLQVER